MSTSIPVNIGTDIVVEAAVHPAPLPPVPNAAVAIAQQAHPPGVALHAARLTRTVRHRRQPLVQRGHDCGPGIPHLTYPIIPNPWLAVIIPGSSCKVLVGAGTVKVDGTPAGASGLVGLMLPMLTCGFPAPTPTAFPVSTITNTVKVGLTPMDLLSGAVHMALDILSAGIMARVFRSPTPPGGHSAMDLVLEGLGKLLPGPKFNLKKWLARQALAAATRFTVSSLRDDPTYQLSSGKHMAGVKFKLRRRDGELDASLEIKGPGVRWKDGDVSAFGEEL